MEVDVIITDYVEPWANTKVINQVDTCDDHDFHAYEGGVLWRALRPYDVDCVF